MTCRMCIVLTSLVKNGKPNYATLCRCPRYFLFKIVLNIFLMSLIFLFPIFVSTCVFDSMSMQVRDNLWESVPFLPWGSQLRSGGLAASTYYPLSHLTGHVFFNSDQLKKVLLLQRCTCFLVWDSSVVLLVIAFIPFCGVLI